MQYNENESLIQLVQFLSNHLKILDSISSVRLSVPLLFSFLLLFLNLCTSFIYQKKKVCWVTMNIEFLPKSVMIKVFLIWWATEHKILMLTLVRLNRMEMNMMSLIEENGKDWIENRLFRDQSIEYDARRKSSVKWSYHVRDADVIYPSN